MTQLGQVIALRQAPGSAENLQRLKQLLPAVEAAVATTEREAIAAGASDAAAAPFMDGKLPAHTEANNVHAGPYGVVQKRAQYLQLLGLDSMHIMIVKELESRLAIVLKKVVQSPELKTTVSNQASAVHTAVPARGTTYDDNTDDLPHITSLPAIVVRAILCTLW